MMPYTEDQLRDGVETSEPKIEASLKLGRHVLELVVVDSAGQVSTPDTVVITVLVPEPLIESINPDRGTQGSEVPAAIAGEKLLGATLVEFSGEGVTATIEPGGTARSLPIKIKIALRAAPGPRTFSVTTLGGTASSPEGVPFTVTVPPPAIRGITPNEGRIASEVSATIAGENLLGATLVEFSGEGVTATIVRRPSRTAESLPIKIKIALRAAPGPRTFSVTTPGGTASSPEGVPFTVTVPPPAIHGITPNEGSIDSEVSATIAGENLLGATLVEFSSEGVTATIGPLHEQTLETLPIQIGITRRAAPGPCTFSVTTLGGTATSPDDAFTVTFGLHIPDTIPDIRGIGPAYAKRLAEHGITDRTELASMEPVRLAKVLRVSEVRAARFIEEAKRGLEG